MKKKGKNFEKLEKDTRCFVADYVLCLPRYPMCKLAPLLLSVAAETLSQLSINEGEQQ